jgi:hypothetical protein
VTILTSGRNRRDGKILSNSFQKEQKQELLPTIMIREENTKDIRKTTDNSAREILVHVQADNYSPEKCIEMFTSVDKGNKVPRCLEGKKQESEVVALSRLIEDVHRDLQIAFAEDLYLYSQANNLDFTELRAALNTKWNVNVPDLEGGIGHPIKRDDSKMLMSYSSKLSGSKIINAIFNVDHEYRKSKKITDDDIH